MEGSQDQNDLGKRQKHAVNKKDHPITCLHVMGLNQQVIDCQESCPMVAYTVISENPEGPRS